MQNKNGRSNTNDIIQNDNLEHLMPHKRNFLRKKKNYQLKLQPKQMKDQISSSQLEEQQEKDSLKKFNDFVNLSKIKQQSKNKIPSKLPVIQKVRSKSSQVQTQNQPNSEFIPEIMGNLEQEKISMRPIFKSINQLLSKHSLKPNYPKFTTESENENFFNNDKSILKQLLFLQRLPEFLNQNKNHFLNIGKYVQEKIEQKRTDNFLQQYKNAAKYQSDEEDSGCLLSSKELQKIDEIKNRRKVIIKIAQRKSPKFLYPLGPKIRVPNYSLENQYFQVQQNSTNRAKGFQPSHKYKNHYSQEDEISIQKLDSPPKDKFFPTSSMQEDYLNIKIQQLVRSLL
ncbi:unnamed protein product [Paramecium sonneborni]|uniref:Uncharacterized protein n=1 Tax=Paramecium sonneborni TaxID=65129 RepID=A0A8S1LBW4_9CILI|nr:unnamed protein product [Paramecium sonneborni]